MNENITAATPAAQTAASVMKDTGATPSVSEEVKVPVQAAVGTRAAAQAPIPSGAASRRAPDFAEAAAQTPSSTDTRREDFERLISGEYKDLFTQRVSGIINRRFADDRRASEELARVRAEAEKGEQSRLTSESAQRLRRSLRATDEAEAVYAAWLGEAEQLKTAYPDFELRAAVSDPAVCRLLKAGVALKTAYEAVNLDAVRKSIEAQAARTAEARALDSVRLQGARPSENGASPGSAVLAGGVKSLTRTERAELARKAMRGLL